MEIRYDVCEIKRIVDGHGEWVKYKSEPAAQVDIVEPSLNNTVPVTAEGQQLPELASNVTELNVSTLISANSVTPTSPPNLLLTVDQVSLSLDEHVEAVTVRPSVHEILPGPTVPVHATHSKAGDVVDVKYGSDNDLDEDGDPKVDIYDPAQYGYRRIDHTIIRTLMDKPCHPSDEFSYPVTGGRRCQQSCFSRTLPDGTCQSRKWLSYSKSTDRLFCLHCMLFGGPVTADSVIWAQHGYNNWHNLYRDLSRHEACMAHRTAEDNRLGWLFSNIRVDLQVNEQRVAQIEMHRRAVAVEIKAIQWLATEMVAFRGHNSFDGKFLSLYTLLAEFDASAKAYLDRLDKIRAKPVHRKPPVNVLSPRNVRRLLTIMKQKTVALVVSNMKLSGVCSLINDGTQDLSRLEASCLLIRYIENVDSTRPRPVERLVGVFTTGSTSGQTICDKVMEHLTDINLPVANIIGQSYDGAGNMAGKYQGLQAKIRELQPKALYVWCSAHRLNLVVEDVVGCCTEVNNAIGILQELFNFFGTHRRHEVLMDLQKESRYKRTLKRVSKTTRTWRSAEDGCTTFLECFDTIVAALQQLQQKNSDSTTVTTARGLLLRMTQLDVIAAVHILHKIFQVTGPASRILQSVACDLSIATHLIKCCTDQLEALRLSDTDRVTTDNGEDQKLTTWEELRVTIMSFAAEHNLTEMLSRSMHKRATKTPRRPGELASDERPTDRMEGLKSVFYRCLDTVIVQMKSRFTDEVLGIVQQMSHFTHSSLMDEHKSVIASTDVYDLCTLYGLDSQAVAEEWNEFRNCYRNMQHMVTVNDLIAGNGGSRSADNTDSDMVSHTTQLVNDQASTEDVHDQQDPDDDDVSASDSEDLVTDNSRTATTRWINYSFVKPLRVLGQLSAYPHLLSIYKILSSLAVTSTSAERALSRVRIIKNRLRTSMADEWFSSLTILAAESDVLRSLTTDEIIDAFAESSPRLREHLL